MIFEYLNDMYTDMHAESIKGWNDYLYKNVKKNKKLFVDKETEESRMINVAGFVEMLLDMEESPYYFSFQAGNELNVVDNRDPKKKLVPASTFSGRKMIKSWLTEQFNSKYKKFERASDDYNYSNTK